MSLSKKLFFYFSAASLSISFNVYADSLIDTTSQYLTSHWVTSISAGPIWTDGGDTQTLTLSPDVVKTYTADKSSQTLAEAELFVGVNQSLPHQLQGQLGLAFVNTSKAGLTGNIWDDASPEFNNYTYHYQLDHSHIALKGKLLLDREYFFIPWISISAGIGFNRASDYSNTPTIEEAVMMPNFASNTETTFTYALGIGVQHQFDPHWQFGIGYEFADWGQSHLDAAPSQTTSQGLSLSHFYTNGILANLTYSA